MTTEETNKAIIGAVGPLKKLSRGGFDTTICGAPLPGKPVGEGLTDSAIELLDKATTYPNIFFADDAPSGLKLFRAGLLMIYVTGGEVYFEPTAIAKRDEQAIVAERRRHAEAIRVELKSRWDAYVAAENGHLRDLGPYHDVLREFGEEVASREARVPAEVIQRRIEEIFAERGYVVEEVRL